MTNKPKTYISGPISGTADYDERFAAACGEVREIGHVPISPLVGSPPGLEWHIYLRRDIRILLECDSIYMLVGWENSRGARLEHLIADGLGLSLLYQKEKL